METRQPQVYKTLWLQAPHKARAFLADKFGIATSVPREVERQNGIDTVKSDGHSDADLAAMTKEKLQEYVGQDGDIHALFALAVEKAMSPEPAVDYGTEGKDIEQVGTESDCPFCQAPHGSIHRKDCPERLKAKTPAKKLNK